MIMFATRLRLPGNKFKPLIVKIYIVNHIEYNQGKLYIYTYIP